METKLKDQPFRKRGLTGNLGSLDNVELSFKVSSERRSKQKLRTGYLIRDEKLPHKAATASDRNKLMLPKHEKAGEISQRLEKALFFYEEMDFEPLCFTSVLISIIWV